MPPGQVRFNRVPEKAPQKVPEKVPGGFGAEPDQVQQGSGEGSWEALAQSQVRLNKICGHLTHGNPAEVFPALGFAARFRKSCKHKKLWRWRYHIYIYIYIYIYMHALAKIQPRSWGFACGLWKSIHFGAQHGRPVSHDVFWNAFSGDSSLFWTIWFCVAGSLEKSVSPNEA